jgi:hypothetical protein
MPCLVIARFSQTLDAYSCLVTALVYCQPWRGLRNVARGTEIAVQIIMLYRPVLGILIAERGKKDARQNHYLDILF